MYTKFLADYKRAFPGFPEQPTLDLGLGIKHIRLRMGLTQEELAGHAKIKPAALKTLENGYAKFTKMSNLEAIAAVLRVDVRKILFESREWFSGNFFVLKLTESSAKEKRKRKRREDVWFRRTPLAYEGCRVDLSSPPLTIPSHFCFAIFEIAPGGTVRDLKLPYPHQVTGFIQKGSLKVAYGSNKEPVNLFANQGFSLRGDKPHEFFNPDKDNPVRVCVAFSLVPSRVLRHESSTKPPKPGISIGRAIHGIRSFYSDSADRALTFAELSYLTGLEETSLRYLENTTEANQVVYWDKIEKITQALKMPLSKFLDLAEGKDEGYFQLATAHDRALIDYRHYLGVRIKSALFPSPTNVYQISEMFVEPRGGIHRPSWRRKDDARIVAQVEDGEILVEVGKNRKAVLKEGESCYFDGSLGYLFTNPGTSPSKLFMASHPPIVF